MAIWEKNFILGDIHNSPLLQITIDKQPDQILTLLSHRLIYDNGQEFIQFTNGKEVLVETAWLWEGERVLLQYVL